MTGNREQGAGNSEFIEQRIISAVRGVLLGRVNELISELEFHVPLIEFGDYCGTGFVCPAVCLSSCERSEKERIIQLEAYSLTITFNVPDTPESESNCYAYSGALSKALNENPTLGGVVDRATITVKKYVPPKKLNCGEDWTLIITLRLTVEEINK